MGAITASIKKKVSITLQKEKNKLHKKMPKPK